MDFGQTDMPRGRPRKIGAEVDKADDIPADGGVEDAEEEDTALEDEEDVRAETPYGYKMPQTKEEFLSLYGVLQALKVNRIGELEGIISRM